MSKPRRQTAYFILVLLILLVVVIIGGLSAVLFNMKPAKPHALPPNAGTQSTLLTNAVGDVTPTEEVLIEIPPEATPGKGKERAETNMGIIPTVCDGFSSQIQNRDAFWGPTAYQASVEPNRVSITITLPDGQPTEGPNNIR